MQQFSNIKNLRIKTAIVLLMLYCYSRFSWGFIIPSIGWGCVLALSCALFVITIAKRGKIKADLNVLNCLLMTLLVIFNRNYDIASFANPFMGYISSLAFPLTCASFAYIALSNKSDWVDLLEQIILLGACWYAAFTLICVFVPPIYYNFFLPILKTHYPSVYINMAASPRAGFSADYGVSSIFMTMGTTVSLTRAYINYKEGLKSWKYWLLTLMIVAAMLCNGKRSTMLALTLGIIVVYLSYEEKRDKYFRIVVILLLVTAGALAASLYVPSLSSFFNRIALLTSELEPDVVDSRSNLWGTAYSAFKEAPIIGKGWRWFKYNNSIYGTRDVHNTYLQLLTENGIIGALPFFGFFSLSCYRAIKLVFVCKKNKADLSSHETEIVLFSVFFQICFLFYMLTTTCFYSGNFTILYFMSCAVSTCMHFQIKRILTKVNENERGY